MTVFVDGCPRTTSATIVFNSLADRINFDDPFIEALVLDVDKTHHIKGRYFESPVLGAISPKELSGGVKSLLTVYCFEGYHYYLTSLFGDNCVEWLRQLSFKRDFGLVYDYALWFHVGNKAIPDLAHRAVMAQTKDGRQLSTCEKVWDYYDEEYQPVNYL